MRIVVFLLALFFLSAPALAQSASRDDALAAYNRATVRPGHDIDRQLLDRLAADFPDHINALREEYVRIYLEQGEFAANSNALPSMTAIIVQLFPHYIRRADDESIIAMNAVTLDFSRAVAQTDPMRCTYNFTGQLMPNGRPAFDNGYAGAQPFTARMEEAVNGVIVNASRNELPVDAPAAESTLAAIIQVAAEQLTPQQIELIAGARPVLTRTDHRDFCQANIVILDSLLARPSGEAANAFRYQMSFTGQ